MSKLSWNARFFPEWNKVMLEAFKLIEGEGATWSSQMIADKLQVSLRTVQRWKAKLKQLKTERFLTR